MQPGFSNRHSQKRLRNIFPVGGIPIHAAQHLIKMTFSSTNMHRTMESLQQVMHGLYPASKLGPDIIPTLLVRFVIIAETVA